MGLNIKTPEDLLEYLELTYPNRLPTTEEYNKDSQIIIKMLAQQELINQIKYVVTYSQEEGT